MYDAHEIFTEVPELVGRKFKQGLWKRLERKIFPKLKFVFTVNDSIAGWYEREYGICPHVVRNIPLLKKSMFSSSLEKRFNFLWIKKSYCYKAPV